MKIFKRRSQKAGYCNITAEPISDLDPKRISVIKKSQTADDLADNGVLATPAKLNSRFRHVNTSSSNGTFSTFKSSLDDMTNTVDVTLTPSPTHSKNPHTMSTKGSLATPLTLPTSSSNNKSIKVQEQNKSIQKRLFSSDTLSNNSSGSSSSSSASSSSSPSAASPQIEEGPDDATLERIMTIEQISHPPKTENKPKYMESLASKVPKAFLDSTPVISNHKTLHEFREVSSGARNANFTFSAPTPRKMLDHEKRGETRRMVDFPPIAVPTPASKPLVVDGSELDQSFAPEIISVASGVTEPSFGERSYVPRNRRRSSHRIWKTIRENFDDTCRQGDTNSPMSFFDSVLDALCAVPPKQSSRR